MLLLLKKLRQDESGVILSTELVLVGTILVIGVVSGLTCLQCAVEGELRDVAGALDAALDQSYSFSSHRKMGFRGHCCAFTAGSSFTNCEVRTDGSAAVVGVVGCNSCQTACVVDGCCSACGATVGPAGCSACGSCGAAFRLSHGVEAAGPRCLGVDVPLMKATEWQSGHQLHVVPGNAPCTDCQSEEAANAPPDLTPVAEPSPRSAVVSPCPVDCDSAEERGTGLNIPDHVW